MPYALLKISINLVEYNKVFRERYPSGLRGRLAKPLDRGNSMRGFESHSLRQFIQMFKKALSRLLSHKYGLVVFIFILANIAFWLGYYWRASGGSSVLSPRTPPLSAQESKWQEEGLLFGDGIYFVGSEIAPGIYRTKGNDTSLYGCRWQRLSGFGAENDNVIVNYSEDQGMATIVAIEASDKGFKTQGCGLWYAQSLSVTESPTEFSDGAFIVGQDIEPGIYKNFSAANAGCRWERLSGLSRSSYNARLFGQDSELITQSRNGIVEIQPSDKAFISYKCLQWTRQDL